MCISFAGDKSTKKISQSKYLVDCKQKSWENEMFQSPTKAPYFRPSLGPQPPQPPKPMTTGQSLDLGFLKIFQWECTDRTARRRLLSLIPGERPLSGWKKARVPAVPTVITCTRCALRSSGDVSAPATAGERAGGKTKEKNTLTPK